MMLQIAALLTDEEVELEKAEAVAVSYPDFLRMSHVWLKEETASEKSDINWLYGCWKNHDWSSFG